MLIYVQILHVGTENNTLVLAWPSKQQMSQPKLLLNSWRHFKKGKKTVLGFLQCGVPHKILHYLYNFAE